MNWEHAQQLGLILAAQDGVKDWHIEWQEDNSYKVRIDNVHSDKRKLLDSFIKDSELKSEKSNYKLDGATYYNYRLWL